jgi:surface antigen
MEENKTLSWQEKIARIEQAPAEVQAMVAKAFIRDDIPDENVQYKFNNDSIEELNEKGMEGVENVNAEPTDEGIGAGSFKMRTSKPYDNKNYIRTATGGWNTCIKGNPTDAHADVLANCVGYASGRFNEIINDAREKTGCTYTNLNCNAENFADRAAADGLEMGSTPRRGAIGCMWGAGDKAGHVFIVERVDSNSRIYTSESGWGSSTAFWNQIRDNSNGRWGMSSSYSFRCFIYLPADVQKIVDGGQPTPPAPTPTPSDKFNIGDHVIINGPLYVNSNAASPAGSTGDRETYITRKNPGSAHPYNTTGDLGWMDESSIRAYQPAPTPPAPTPTPGLQVGDKVKIVGTGNGSSYGDSNTAYGIGWTRQILRIWDGRPYPYQVGNGSGTTGFYKADALQKI